MGLTFNLGRVSPSVFTDSSLNVGIGAAPSGSYKFEVTGTAKVSSTLLVSGAATFSSSVTALASTTNGFIAQTTANSVYPYFRWVANNRSYWAAAIDNGTDAPFSIGNGNTIGANTLFTLTPSNNTATFSGSVGVGAATNVNGTLEVWGSGASVAQFSIGRSASIHTDFFIDATGNYYIQPLGVTKLTLLTTGNMGIGTTSPRGLLQIYGAEVSAYKTYTGQGNTGGGDTIINAYRLDSASAYLRVTDIVALGDDTNNRASTIRLMTTSTSGSTTSALTIAATGNVLIGATTDYSADYKLQVSGGSIKHYLNNENCALNHSGSMTVANGGTKTLGIANGGLVFISENNTGDGAVFFCTYASSTITLIADPNGHYAATNTAGKACLYKSANSSSATFINNLGSSRGFTIYQIQNSD